MEIKKSHSQSCTKVFSRYDANCPRCQELIAGAPARAGYASGRRDAETQQMQCIAEHFAPGGAYSRMSSVEKMMDTKFSW